MTSTLVPNTDWTTVLKGTKTVSELDSPDEVALLKATKVEIGNFVEGVTGESAVNVGLRSYYRSMVQLRVKAPLWAVVEPSLDTTLVDVGYMVRAGSGFLPSTKLLASLRRVRIEKGARAILDENGQDPWGAVVVEDERLYLPTSLGAEGWGGSGKYAHKVIALHGRDTATLPENTVIVDLFGLSKDVTCSDIVSGFADAIVAGTIQRAQSNVQVSSSQGSFVDKNSQSRTFVTLSFTDGERNQGLITKVANYFLQSKTLSHPIVAILRDFTKNVAYHSLKGIYKRRSAVLSVTDLSITGEPMGVVSRKDNKELGLVTAVVPKGFTLGTYPSISDIAEFHTAGTLAAQRSQGGDINLTLYATDIEKTTLKVLLIHVAISFATCGAAGNYYDFAGKGACKPVVEDLVTISDVEKVDIQQANQPVNEQPSAPFDVAQALASGDVLVSQPQSSALSNVTSTSTSTDPQNVLWSRYLETVAARRAASRARSSRSKKARPRSRSGRFRRSRSRSRSRTRRGKSPARRRKSRSRSRSRARTRR